MKKMIKNKAKFKKELYTKQYSNGQLAVYIYDHGGAPIAELSIMHNSVELSPNEFILKDYSENKEIVRELFESNIIMPSNRFILISSHLCPICQITS